MKHIISSTLKRGSIELNKMLDLIDQNSANPLGAIVQNFGIIVGITGRGTSTEHFNNDWSVTSLGSSIALASPMYAVLQDSNGRGRYVNASGSTNLSVASLADGTYNILIQYNPNNYEAGTVSITAGATAVTGSGTVFTKIFATNRSIIINNVAYLIQSVTDDTHLTLNAAFSGGTVSAVQFKVGGWFITTPGSVNDYLIYEYDAVQFLVTASNPSGYQLLIGKVTVAGGFATSYTDLRDQSLLSLKTDVYFNPGAFTNQSLNDASTRMVIWGGQLRNFPSSYTSDYNTYFVLDSNGTPRAFKYTSRTTVSLEGVTFNTSPFNVNSGAFVFRKNTTPYLSASNFELGGSLLNLVNSKTYNMSLNAITNLSAAPTVAYVYYTRIGNTVIVYGNLTLTPTAGSTFTSFRMNVPVSVSTIVLPGGSFGVTDNSNIVAGVIASNLTSPTDNVTFSFKSPSNSLLNLFFSFVYPVN